MSYNSQRMNEAELANKIEEASLELVLKPELILSFLAYISSKDGVDSKVLLRRFGLAETQYKKTLQVFRDFLLPPPGLIRMKDGEMMNKIVGEHLAKIRNINKTKITEVLAKYKAYRPKPNREFDQFFATRETTAKRAIRMAKAGDLYRRNIAFLGDDDLNSVAAALTGQAVKITVFEIDLNIIEVITKIASEENLDIEIVKYDARQPIPKSYLEKFDTVFTDPPYTPAGISLFVNRGIELMKNKFTSRLYLCYGNSERARERELEIQKIIFEKGLLINTKLFQFNKYHGAESIGSSSSLYLLDWTPKIKLTKVNTERLYTNE